MESLLFRSETSQLCWYGHVTRMYQERTTKKLLCSTPIGPGPAPRGGSCPPPPIDMLAPPLINKLILFMTADFVLKFHTLIPPDKRLAPLSRLLCRRRRLWIWSKLDGEITLTILVGLALASQPNIYPLLQRIKILGGSNSSCCSRDPPRISRSRKVSS